MKLISTPGNPVPDGAVTGKIRTPDRGGAALRALGCAGRRQGNGLRLRRTRRVHRKIFRDGARAAPARLCGRDDGLARDRGTRRGNCPIRARGMSRVFRSSGPTSKRSCSKWCLPIVRRPILRWRIRWAARCCCASAHSGKRWFERTVLVSPMIDFPGARASLPLRMLVHGRCALRALARSYVPGGNLDGSEASGFPGNPLTSDPRALCAQRLDYRARIQRSELVRRRWHGWRPRLRRW